jgi:hypothetical protein
MATPSRWQAVEPGPEVLKNGKSFAGANIAEKSGAASPVGETMGFRENTSQSRGRMPAIDQCMEDILNYRV